MTKNKKWEIIGLEINSEIYILKTYRAWCSFITQNKINWRRLKNYILRYQERHEFEDGLIVSVPIFEFYPLDTEKYLSFFGFIKQYFIDFRLPASHLDSKTKTELDLYYYQLMQAAGLSWVCSQCGIASRNHPATCPECRNQRFIPIADIILQTSGPPPPITITRAPYAGPPDDKIKNSSFRNKWKTH